MSIILWIKLKYKSSKELIGDVKSQLNYSTVEAFPGARPSSWIAEQMALNPNLNKTCGRFQSRQSTGLWGQIHSSNQDHHTEQSPVQHFDTLEFHLGVRFLWSEGCPLSIQKETSCKKHFFNTNTSGFQYVAIRTVGYCEGQAETAIRTSKFLMRDCLTTQLDR